jgi:hypothetical protein
MDYNTNYSSFELYNNIDIYMNKNYNFYLNNTLENKTELIEYTKYLHELLVHNCNFMKIVNEYSEYIDKQIDKYDNLEFVTFAIDYLFSNNFFEYLLNINIDYLDNDILENYHYYLIFLLVINYELYNKYNDEESINNIIFTEKTTAIIKLIKTFYYNLITKENEYDDTDNNIFSKSKEYIMELLCSFDLEDIYN